AEDAEQVTVNHRVLAAWGRVHRTDTFVVCDGTPYAQRLRNLFDRNVKLEHARHDLARKKYAIAIVEPIVVHLVGEVVDHAGKMVMGNMYGREVFFRGDKSFHGFQYDQKILVLLSGRHVTWVRFSPNACLCGESGREQLEEEVGCNFVAA
ncbi:MAG: hypothetical protein LQ341_007588, partial [Variospora aurantia]